MCADTPDASGEVHRCDFCRLPIPGDPVSDQRESVTYEFCSKSCRRALDASEYVFTEYHGSRRITPGVAALEASLPQGLPRNAFVLLSGQAGTRDRAIEAELVWRTLRRDEPVVLVTFREPPGSLVQQFLTLEWNVLPYLETGQLHLLDCFTYRVSNRERMFDRMSDWNAHLYSIAEDATTTVRDPSDIGELQNKLDNCLSARDMVTSGIVVVDSLTEFGTLTQPVQSYNFVKDIRADICKGRSVPVFAGATFSGEADRFPHDLTYVVDGLVDMRLNSELVEDALIKQIRIRKMHDVLVIPRWHAYEYTSDRGMVLFDPAEEQRKSRGEGADAGAGDGNGDEGDEKAPDGDDASGEAPAGGDDRAGADASGSETPADTSSESDDIGAGDR